MGHWQAETLALTGPPDDDQSVWKSWGALHLQSRLALACYWTKYFSTLSPIPVKMPSSDGAILVAGKFVQVEGRGPEKSTSLARLTAHPY
jgi:hypothetical protein